MKILYIASHRKNRSPGQRFRFEQYWDYFESQGIHCELSYFISDRDDKFLYRKGKYFQKLIILLKATIRRFKDLYRANEFDIIFIHREAFVLGFSFFERQFSKSNAKIIFDFDDSIWMNDTSDANKKLRWLKYPGKIAHIISYADMVFAGNKYLADYASYYNSCVKIIPTTIDTDEHKRIETQNSASAPHKKDEGKETITIGWTGSITTIKHFEHALPFLKELKKTYKDRLIIKVIGDEDYENKELGIKGQAWSRETEIKELLTFDIGIMPLPDDEWSKGKCGLKGLLYMSLEIPAIMSPVGVNNDIITDGVNGFLAKDDKEWLDKISMIIEDKKLRAAIGRAARQTVIEKYSKESQKKNYIKYFNEVLEITGKE